MIEQLPAIVVEQVKAIHNLQIDKITVWDLGHNGGGGNGATADFLSGLIGALPAAHELAEQAGIELPPALGRLQRRSAVSTAPVSSTAHAASRATGETAGNGGGPEGETTLPSPVVRQGARLGC